jgi:colanic acid/amylovoran biosynthesis glycosyltransferase
MSLRHFTRGKPALRVGYVSDRFPSASRDFVLQEILGLQALGIAVDVFSLGFPDGRLDDTAIALGRLDGRVRYFPDDAESDELQGAQLQSRQALWVAGEVVARGIGHLHAHSATTPTDVAREAGRLAGVGYSFTAYNDGLYDGADVPLLRK